MSERFAICPNVPQGQPSWILMRKRFPEIRRANRISAKIEREFTWTNDLRKWHTHASGDQCKGHQISAMRNFCGRLWSARPRESTCITCRNNFCNYTTSPPPSPFFTPQFKSRSARQRQTWWTGTCSLPQTEDLIKPFLQWQSKGCGRDIGKHCGTEKNRWAVST